MVEKILPQERLTHNTRHMEIRPLFKVSFLKTGGAGDQTFNPWIGS